MTKMTAPATRSGEAESVTATAAAANDHEQVHLDVVCREDPTGLDVSVAAADTTQDDNGRDVAGEREQRHHDHGGDIGRLGVDEDPTDDSGETDDRQAELEVSARCGEPSLACR